MMPVFSKMLLIGLSLALVFFLLKRSKNTGSDNPSQSNKNGSFPFLEISLAEAKALADRTSRTLLILLIDDKTTLKEMVISMGMVPEKKLWQRQYVPIVLTTDQEEAKALMEANYIQYTPTVLQYQKGIDASPSVLYGRFAFGSKEPYLTAPMAESLYQAYLGGDQDHRLLHQLKSHLLYLSLEAKAQDRLSIQIDNAIQDQWNSEELTTYADYRLLTQDVKDVRLHLFWRMLEDQAYFQALFEEVEKGEGITKHKKTVRHLLLQAIRSSLKKAAWHNDADLFAQSLGAKEQLEAGYMDQFMAGHILDYRLKNPDMEARKKAAVQYFEHNKNWYASGKYRFMYEGAKAVYKTSSSPEELAEAARWLERAVNRPGKARLYEYQLYHKLLLKTGNTTHLEKVEEEIANYQSTFRDMLQHYPVLSGTITLDQERIHKKAYEQLESLPKAYSRIYHLFITEGSLFKQGEKVEPIGVLSQDENSITLLTRIHRQDGSLLPVSHFRSYYITAVFSKEGELQNRAYEQRAQITL